MKIKARLRTLGKFLTDPMVRLNILSHYKLLKWMSSETFLKKAFRYSMGRELNLENPVTYTEKLQWLKLYDHRPEYTRMVDKLHSGAQVKSVDYTGEGIVVETVVDPILYGRLKDYITKEL